MKDITVEYVQNMKINSELVEEFREKGYISDETLIKIWGPKPILASNYMDCDSMIMAGEQIHLWRTCQDALYERLRKEAS